MVFQGGRHLKKDGTTNVKIRVYHNSSAQYIPTEYFIEPDLMNEDGSISSLSANSENLNYEITNLVQKYRGAYIKLGSTRTAKMSCSELKERLPTGMSHPLMLLLLSMVLSVLMPRI